MNLHRKPIKPLILIAEDDPDDRLLLKMTFNEEGCELRFVEDGVELMNYLHGNACIPMPSSFFWDLRMPRKRWEGSTSGNQERMRNSNIYRSLFGPPPTLIKINSSVRKRVHRNISQSPPLLLEMDAAIKDIVKRWLPLPSIAEEATKGRAINQYS